MAISPQRLTIYLYSAHHAIMFAIAQLSYTLSYRYLIICMHAMHADRWAYNYRICIALVVTTLIDFYFRIIVY